MDKLLSLKWNNHHNSFLELVGELRKKDLYTDVTLACEQKLYPAHKFVLSTSSEYFGYIFETANQQNPIIILKDIKSSDLEAMLDYMYYGEVKVKQEDIFSFINAAECLKVKGLAVPDITSDYKKRQRELEMTEEEKKVKVMKLEENKETTISENVKKILSKSESLVKIPEPKSPKKTVLNEADNNILVNDRISETAEVTNNLVKSEQKTEDSPKPLYQQLSNVDNSAYEKTFSDFIEQSKLADPYPEAAQTNKKPENAEPARLSLPSTSSEGLFVTSTSVSVDQSENKNSASQPSPIDPNLATISPSPIPRTKQMEHAGSTWQEPYEAQLADKAYKCALCPESFPILSGLNQHIMQHKKTVKIVKDKGQALSNETDNVIEKPETSETTILKKFKCSLCDKEYATRGNVIRHYKGKHPGYAPTIKVERVHLKINNSGGVPQTESFQQELIKEISQDSSFMEGSFQKDSEFGSEADDSSIMENNAFYSQSSTSSAQPNLYTISDNVYYSQGDPANVNEMTTDTSTTNNLYGQKNNAVIYEDGTYTSVDDTGSFVLDFMNY